jgi:hypothetical protein
MPAADSTISPSRIQRQGFAPRVRDMNPPEPGGSNLAPASGGGQTSSWPGGAAIPGSGVTGPRDGPAHLVGTDPQVRLAQLAVMALARSEARKTAAFPTSSRDVSRFSIVFPCNHRMSPSRVIAPPVP